MDKPTILLVEDSEDDAFFFSRTFRGLGADYALKHVLHGGQAVDYLGIAATAKALPEIIFLDLKMPVLNGFDFLTWMQKQKFPKAIPVVVLSGSDQPEDKKRAAQLGAIDYLVKPLETVDLERFLKKVSPAKGGPANGNKGTKR